MLNIFTYNSYENTNNLKEKFLILRHDIDFDIEKAREFAMFENQLGIDSTYFFRPNGKFYNLLSPHTLNIINEVNSLGHEVGIHLEVNLFEKYEFEKLINELLEIFNKNLNLKIHSYSLHEPNRTGDKISHENICKKFGFSIGAYEDRFFKEIKYLSDSGGRWREGHFNEWVDKENKLQVLTHPIWWYREFPQENY
jgi:hypothetical protein